jgi:hypothetical protein
MTRHLHQEKISMFRSLMIGIASFAITSVMILGSGLQGSGIIG